MKIAVCIKQVPSQEEIRFDPERNTLVREGVTNQANPFDRRAIAKAVLLRDEVGGEVVAVTMGPPQAVDVLRLAISMGVDRVVHLCDPALAGADTLATARALAAYLRTEAFDLILCGKYSIDAETGQLGPELAALLGIPSVTGAAGIELCDGRLLIRREVDYGFDTMAVDPPVLLTASEYLTPTPKMAPERLAAARLVPVSAITAAELRLDVREIGLAGSPTSVRGLRAVEVSRQPIVFDGDDPDVTCDRLVEALIARGAFERVEDRLRALPTPARAPRADRELCVVAQVADGCLHPVTLEMLGEAAHLAAQVGGSVSTLLIGADGYDHVAQLAAHGANVVYVAADSGLDSYDAERYAFVLEQVIRAYRPWAVLAGATSEGRDFVPRAAATLGLGLTGDAIGFEADDSGRLVQLKPAFGGMIVAEILSQTVPAVATVRPGMLESTRPDPTRRVSVVSVDLGVGLPVRRVQLVQRERAAETAAELETADRVVCVGQGIGGPGNLHYVEGLAVSLGAALGATRRVVDNGWLPQQHQIGITGHAVSPQLYVGVAVSGNFNHTVGLQRAKTVVVLNNDPAALLFRQADFGVVGDYRETVPALVRALQRAEVDSTAPA
jgi:electron transfer flavoprotein alpha subunit